MPAPTSTRDIDLRPPTGRTYFSCTREWREEFIYFVLVDRFHDGRARPATSQAARSVGFPAGGGFYGGTLRGIAGNLDYIAGLGCTAIWLSPVFETRAYHGYDICNYLDIDPHFGTKQDLIDLVTAAHGYKKGGKALPIRVILDVVINHSGDNWEYHGGWKPYCDDQPYAFGRWRAEDYPVPTELRNPDWYHRRGQMSNYDAYPELQHGDVCGLKDYANDDDAIGSAVINTLIAAHCYWIREADVDGFRVDAVKHMGELACSRFCSAVREYAYALGKRGFFLFGEVAARSDDIYDRYIGQNTSSQDGAKTVFYGLTSVLDFRLAEGQSDCSGLRDVLKGFAWPQCLFNRLQAQQNRALNRGEIGRYLVTFLDNHDAFWQRAGRFGAGAPQEQIIAGVGYLLCALGTPCIYYGTEQGFEGKGDDTDIREAMYDQAEGGSSLLNTQCTIYQEIAKIAEVMRGSEPLRFGRMYYREISGDGRSFGLPYGTDYTLAFSRILYSEEVLVAYNVSGKPREDCVIVDASYHKPGDTMTYLYSPQGAGGKVPVEASPGAAAFVRLKLGGNAFAILQ